APGSGEPSGGADVDGFAVVHSGDDHVGVDDVALAGGRAVGVDGVGGGGERWQRDCHGQPGIGQVSRFGGEVVRRGQDAIGWWRGVGARALPVAAFGREVVGLFQGEVGDQSGELVVDGGLDI